MKCKVTGIVKNKKVTLYIPCFNAEKYIEPCLKAVLGQDYPIDEILVIDDGSRDRTPELASRFPVRFIRHPENKGLASVRNSAIKNSKGDFLASLDADCVPDKSWLKSLMRNFSSKVAGVGGRLLENQHDNPVDLWRAAHMRQEWGDRKSDSISFLFGSNNVFRKKILLDTGGYDMRHTSNYEDVDISRRVKKAGHVLIYDPRAVVCHIRRDSFFSVLDTFWNWNFGYHQEKGYYDGLEGIYLKIKENIGLGNRFMEEDFRKGKTELLYLDLLVSIYLSLKDFFFLHNKMFPSPKISRERFYVSYVSLIDLTLFYHLDSRNKSFRTLVPHRERSFQNLFAFLLLTGKALVKEKEDRVFLERLFTYFLGNFAENRDADLDFLVKKLSLMVDLHKDWSGFLKKAHPNLDREFLSTFLRNFQKSWNSLTHDIPGLFKLIKESQEISIKKEGR